jgi:hypothetical protein
MGAPRLVIVGQDYDTLPREVLIEPTLLGSGLLGLISLRRKFKG